MKFFPRSFFIFMFIYLNNLSITKSQEFPPDGSDPFRSLGIPDINPQKMLEDIESTKSQNQRTNEIIKLKSIADVPRFLKFSNITAEDAIDTVSKFLIQDDSNLKSLGVIYDQTGFDGLKKGTIISNFGTEDRFIQRAKSSAYLWVINYFIFFDFCDVLCKSI